MGRKRFSVFDSNPRFGSLDHQPARRDRCAAVCFSDTVFCLGCDCDVVGICCRLSGDIASQAKFAGACLAMEPQVACGCGCDRHCCSCTVDRRYDGIFFKGNSMLTRSRRYVTRTI